jgi:hypothetical protein
MTAATSLASICISEVGDAAVDGWKLDIDFCSVIPDDPGVGGKAREILRV